MTENNFLEKTPKNTAILVIDFQADFISYFEGSLAVPGTDKLYIEQVNKVLLTLSKKLFS